MPHAMTIVAFNLIVAYVEGIGFFVWAIVFVNDGLMGQSKEEVSL